MVDIGLKLGSSQKIAKLEFNARSESAGEKASFRRLLPKSRCLVAVEGFYEWKKDGSKKQPYYVHFKDGRPLVFAALYDSWQNPQGETVYTFTILTTSSSSALEWLHDRMPVILGDKNATDSWLDDLPSTKNKMLLKPYEASDLVWYPVTAAMGKPSFDGPECIKEIQLTKTQEKNITSFFSRKVAKEEEEEPARDQSSDVMAKGKTKREHEELLDDSNGSAAEERDDHKAFSDPPPKKAALGSQVGDKESTLKSYFCK